MLPNLIIIGAQKCGTTSLHYYLDLHPQISMSKPKELDFFLYEGNWHRGIEWYASHFNGNAKIRGESSVGYTNYPTYKGVGERMSSVVPEAKLIYLVRDPIARILSHYMQWVAEAIENRKLEEALTDFENNCYIARSQYYIQLEQYLRYFPRSNVLIIAQEDLLRSRRPTLKTVFRFLNVDDSFDSRRFSRLQNISQVLRRKNTLGLLVSPVAQLGIVKKLPPGIQWRIEMLPYFPFSKRVDRPSLDSRLRERLIEFLRDDVDRLRAYTGCQFGDWCL